MKTLALQYKEKKDLEVSNLNVEIDKFKAMIEESNSLYESILDKTTKSLQNIINNTESKSELQ
jgi:nitrate reductase assembly molybdenum cofactor insertion protein NarJ